MIVGEIAINSLNCDELSTGLGIMLSERRGTT